MSRMEAIRRALISKFRDILSISRDELMTLSIFAGLPQIHEMVSRILFDDSRYLHRLRVKSLALNS